jgi:hypothetical protein
MAFIDSIKNYKDYLQCVKKWERLSTMREEMGFIFGQEQLKKWYRNYYSQNKESERLRYRNYYTNNSDIEKGRLKKYKKSKMG